MSAPIDLLPFNFRQLEPNGQWLLTNSTGAFAYISDRATLDSVINTEVQGLEPDLIDQLIAKNFLCYSEEKFLRSEILASRLATQIARAIKPPALFMVVPTLRCDHDCGYCQVSRVPAGKAGYDLDSSYIDSILNTIYAIPNSEIKIEFQGGEPLLAFNFIREFYQRAEAVLDGIKIRYVICTATGPLDDSIIEWAKGKPIDFSVSLDGTADIHNTNRPSKFFDAHTQTIKTINKIRDTLGKERVDCLTTISKYSLNYPIDVVNSYFSLGFSSIFLRPLSPFGFAAKTQHRIGYSVEKYMDFYEKCLLHIIDLNKETLFIEDTALIHLRKIFQPQNSSYIDLQSPSGYVFGALVFNYDGKVFGSDEARMLWQSTGVDELVLGEAGGSIDDLLIGKETRQLLASSYTCSSPGCDECAYQPYCGADPLHHLASQGDLQGDKSLSFFCQYQQALFDLLFSLWNNNPRAKRTFQKWLAH